MRIVIVYGPPGVGKLTVANELAKRIGARVFHNHMVINLVEPIVTRKHPGFTPFVYDLQRQILVAAMEARQTDLILTFAFSRDEREAVEFMDAIRDAGSRLGVEIHFVYLNCAHEQHVARLIDPKRKELGKLVDVERLESMAREYDLLHPYDGAKGMVLDTTDMTAAEAADVIVASLDRSSE